jgi:hypothetical protein
MAGLHNLKPNIRTSLPVVGGDEGEDYGRRIGKLTATVEGAKKVSKKGLTKIWKKKSLGG